MRVAALLLCAALGACSSQARVSEDQRPVEHKMQIRVLTDGVTMGGYTIMVKWDPAIATIEKITPCRDSTFPGTPEFSTTNFSRGWVKIWGLTTSKHTVPTEYDICMIYFRPHRSEKFTPTVEVHALYDMAKRPKPITGRLNVFPAAFDFSQPAQ